MSFWAVCGVRMYILICCCCLDNEPVLGRHFSKGFILLPLNNPEILWSVPSNASSPSVSVDETLNLCCQKNCMCFLDAGRLLSIFVFQIQHQFFNCVLPLIQPTTSIPSSYYLETSSAGPSSGTPPALAVCKISLPLALFILRRKGSSSFSCLAFTVMPSDQNSDGELGKHQLWSHLLHSYMGFSYCLNSG